MEGRDTAAADSSFAQRRLTKEREDLGLIGFDTLITDVFYAPSKSVEGEFVEGVTDIPLPPSRGWDEGKQTREDTQVYLARVNAFFRDTDGRRFVDAYELLMMELRKYAVDQKILGALKVCNNFFDTFIKIRKDGLPFEDLTDVPLYRDGLPILFNIIKYIKSVEGDPNKYKDQLSNIISGIKACGPGAHTAFAAGYTDLLSKQNIARYYTKIRFDLVQQALIARITPLLERYSHQGGSGEPFIPNAVGMEMHYANAVLNVFDEVLGYLKVEDEYTQGGNDDDPNNFHCKPWFVERMILETQRELKTCLSLDKILDKIVSDLDQKLDAILTANDNAEKIKSEEEFEELLKLTGKKDIKLHDLLVRADDGKFVSKSYRCKLLLEYHVAQGLIVEGCIDRSTFKEKDRGRVIVTEVPQYPKFSSVNVRWAIRFDTVIHQSLDKAEKFFQITERKEIFCNDFIHPTLFIAGVDHLALEKQTNTKLRESAEKNQLIDYQEKINSIKVSLGMDTTEIQEVESKTLAELREMTSASYQQLVEKLRDAGGVIILTTAQKDILASHLSGQILNKASLIEFMTDYYLRQPQLYQKYIKDLKLDDESFIEEMAEAVALFLSVSQFEKISSIAKNLPALLQFSKLNKNARLTENNICFSILTKMEAELFNIIKEPIEDDSHENVVAKIKKIQLIRSISNYLFGQIRIETIEQYITVANIGVYSNKKGGMPMRLIFMQEYFFERNFNISNQLKHKKSLDNYATLLSKIPGEMRKEFLIQSRFVLMNLVGDQFDSLLFILDRVGPAAARNLISFLWKGKSLNVVVSYLMQSFEKRDSFEHPALLDKLIKCLTIDRTHDELKIENIFTLIDVLKKANIKIEGQVREKLLTTISDLKLKVSANFSVRLVDALHLDVSEQDRLKFIAPLTAAAAAPVAEHGIFGDQQRGSVPANQPDGTPRPK